MRPRGGRRRLRHLLLLIPSSTAMIRDLLENLGKPMPESNKKRRERCGSTGKSVLSLIDELEDFAMGKPQTYPQEHSGIFSGEKETETNSAAAASTAAMKEAMDRAEAKFNHAKEVRERGRDAKFTKIKQSMHQEDLEDNWEQEQKEQEYREEQKRLAKEREQELEREIERNRQAVERAAREARERATAEAQLRAERAAVEKANAEANFSWASMFGGLSSSGEFQEIEGESEHRRRARFERCQRTLERVAKALAEKNERDMQTRKEKAERHRIAETLDIGIKAVDFWYFGLNVAGPVSLTDLINAASVKKIHRKATLCLHPDKVQQKGATLQQKYITEKVFELLRKPGTNLTLRSSSNLIEPVLSLHYVDRRLMSLRRSLPAQRLAYPITGRVGENVNV
ncbi:hypothetical protein OPV22_028695 [Ensete ventricosum]|uniref:J domain-containing protein n=1 Tax=Ensete ventricosum TaxID=4639 RepID=A0AAV8Q942_ENSVE|nr:hypothetical protein OPV22_028695 [Ensete ventricosum]